MRPDLVRASRGRLGGADDPDVRGAGHPLRAARAGRRRAAVPELRPRAASRSCCTSPRPACCARSAPCARSRARPSRTARGSCAAARRRTAPAARLDDGRVLEADVVVWACGAWLGRLFPAHVAIRTTRQELFFFDGGPAWRAAGVPAYVDFEQAIYGTRDIDGLGVKAAPDFDGPPLDPDAELPPATRAGRGARAALPRRALPGARGRAAERLEDAAATSSRPTPTSSPRRIPSTRPSGCSAAAPATASSTARRSPSSVAAALAGDGAAAAALRARRPRPGQPARTAGAVL